MLPAGGVTRWAGRILNDEYCQARGFLLGATARHTIHESDRPRHLFP
jgi:hypothetical protein